MGWLTIRQAAEARGDNYETLRKRVQRHPEEFHIMRRSGLPLLIEVEGVEDDLSLTGDETGDGTAGEEHEGDPEPETTVPPRPMPEIIDITNRWLAHVEQITRQANESHARELATKDAVIIEKDERISEWRGRALRAEKEAQELRERIVGQAKAELEEPLVAVVPAETARVSWLRRLIEQVRQGPMVR